MLVFLDLEASSLVDGFPTEVAWVRHGDDARFSTLIRSEPDWIEYFKWDLGAEAITGISKADLATRGRLRIEVAAELKRDLTGHRVFVSGGQHDVEWLHMVTNPDTIRVEDFDGLIAATAGKAGWRGTAGAEALELAIRDGIEAAGLRQHRALDDAKALLIAFELALAGPPQTWA